MKDNKIVWKKRMDTLVSCLSYLKTIGFVTQFKATADGLLSIASQRTFLPEEVKIAHFYRFEGESNPSDSSILYAIEAINGEKGTLVDGYGIASDQNVNDFIQKVKSIHK